MFKSPIARTILCLVLVFVLVFNIYAMPTKASATGTLVTVGALTFITCALIGLGIHAGTTNADFNSIASNCLSSLQGSGAISGDSVLGYLVNGKVHFLQSLIEAVRSWFFSSPVFSSSSTTIYLNSYGYSKASSNKAFNVCSFKFSGSFYLGFIWSVNPSRLYLYDESGALKDSFVDDVLEFTTHSSNSPFWVYSVGVDSYSSSFPYLGDLSSYSTSHKGALNSYVNTTFPDGLPDTFYDLSFSDVFPSDSTSFVDGYSTWYSNSVSVPSSTVGGTSDEPVPMLPLGLGSTVEESLGMSQEEVWAGAGTYTGESTETEDGETNEGELNTDPVKWASLAALLSKISDFLTGRLDTLINLVTVVRDWCNDWWDKLGTTFPALIAEWWSSVWTHVDDSFDSVLISIRDGISGMKQWVDTAWDDFVTTFPTAMSKWWEDVWTHVDDTFDSVLIGIRDGVAGIRTWANEWWDTLTVTLPKTIAKWWEGVWTDARSIPDFLTAALENVVSKILEGIRDIFVPSEDYWTDKLEAIRSEFSFFDSIVSSAAAIGASVSLPGSEPPVIYVHLENAEGEHRYGDTVAILDMNWYARYKPTVDKILSVFLWLCFIWKVFKQAPGIINGAVGDVVFVPIDAGTLPAPVNKSYSNSRSIRRLR